MEYFDFLETLATLLAAVAAAIVGVVLTMTPFFLLETYGYTPSRVAAAMATAIIILAHVVWICSRVLPSM